MTNFSPSGRGYAQRMALVEGRPPEKRDASLALAAHRSGEGGR